MGEEEDEGVDDDEEIDAAGAGTAASFQYDAAEPEEVATSSSYVIVRPEVTVSLRDASVQTSHGVSSLRKSAENKRKNQARRRAKKRKQSTPSLPAAEAAPAVSASPAVTEPAPPTPTPPSKKSKTSPPDA